MEDYYVKIRHSFWEDVSQELKAGEMRMLVLMLSQKKDFVIHSGVIEKKLGISQQNVSRSMIKLKNAGYVILPKQHKDKGGNFTSDGGYKLTTKATKYLANADSRNYQFYWETQICDKTISNNEWLINSFLSCYPEDSVMRFDFKTIAKKLHIDVRTVKKYIEPKGISALEIRVPTVEEIADAFNF